MTFGLDYVTGPPVDTLKSSGVTFVCRYTGYFSGYNDTAIATQQGKCLTPGEAKTLSDAGISVVSNWEWDGKTPLLGFHQGVWDATEANKIHLGCGGPSDRPIYFSVDVDVDGSQVVDYFKGVASVIGLQRTGAYGSYRVLKYLFDTNTITYGWQTYAWSGGAWEPRAHIQQYQNGVNLAGHSVDYDRAIKSDFGQWRIGGTTMGVPTGWHDDGTTLTAPNGHRVVKGFRDYVLAHNWDASNVPDEEERSTPQLEDSNPALGGGSQQIFRYTMLAWKQSSGVFVESVGSELLVCRQQVAKYYPAYSQLPGVQKELATANATIGSLQEQIKTLQDELAQAKTQAAGIDATTVNARLASLVTLLKQGESLASEPLS